MTPETFIAPNMNILPFEMFRSFAPTFDRHWPFTAWTPLCDIYETEKEIVLKMELPEMRKEDVRVTLENNVLTLRGERKFEETVNRENYYLIERKYGEFIRLFTLPTFVEGSKVLAEFKEGMLTVTLPKNAAAIPRQIEVKVMYIPRKQASRGVKPTVSR
jgi:HSP20 family protein